MEHIINPVYYQDFILAGNCEFTLRSLKSGKEEMFVVKKAKADKLYWVNNRLRELIGQLHLLHGASEDIWVYSPNAINITVFQANQIKIFSWFWLKLIENKSMIDQIQIVNPYNRCAHCHRPLTHPESIPIGIGPDCFKKLNLTHKKLIT